MQCTLPSLNLLYWYAKNHRIHTWVSYLKRPAAFAMQSCNTSIPPRALFSCLFSTFPNHRISHGALNRFLTSCNVQSSKIWYCHGDIQTCSIEDMLGRWNTHCQVSVFCKPGDEEHEATGFDLKLSEIGTSGRNASVFSVAPLVY
jgi:hypothetical protein